MANKQLIEYIQKAAEQGYRADEIKKILTSNGWPIAEIESAMMPQKAKWIKPLILLSIVVLILGGGLVFLSIFRPDLIKIFGWQKSTSSQSSSTPVNITNQVEIYEDLPSPEVVSELSLSPDNRWLLYSGKGLESFVMFDITKKKGFTLKPPTDTEGFYGKPLLLNYKSGWTPDSKYFFYFDLNTLPNIEDSTKFPNFIFAINTKNPDQPTIETFSEFNQKVKNYAELNIKTFAELTCSDCKDTLDNFNRSNILAAMKNIDPTLFRDDEELQSLRKKQGLPEVFTLKNTSAEVVFDKPLAKAWFTDTFVPNGDKIYEYNLLEKSKSVVVTHKPKPFTDNPSISKLVISPNDQHLIYFVSYSQGSFSGGGDWFWVDLTQKKPLTPTKIVMTDENGLASRPVWATDNETIYGLSTKGLLKISISAAQTSESSLETTNRSTTDENDQAVLEITPKQSTYKPGQQLTLEVKPKKGSDIKAVLFFFIGGTETVESAPFKYNVTIPPKDTEGDLTISVLLRRGDGSTEQDFSQLERTITVK